MSEIVVPFFSQHYQKPWCKLEWDSIRSMLMGRQQDDAVFAVKMDDCEIPGWRRTDFHIDRHGRNAEEIAQLILKRIGRGTGTTRHRSRVRKWPRRTIIAGVVLPLLVAALFFANFPNGTEKKKRAAVDAARRALQTQLASSVELEVKYQSIVQKSERAYAGFRNVVENVKTTDRPYDRFRTVVENGKAADGTDLIRYLAQEDFPSFCDLTLGEMKEAEIISWLDLGVGRVRELSGGDTEAQPCGAKWVFFDFNGYDDVETRVEVWGIQELDDDRPVPYVRFQIVTKGYDLNQTPYTDERTLHVVLKMAIEMEQERHSELGKFSYDLEPELQPKWERAEELQFEMSGYLLTFVDTHTGQVRPDVPLRYDRIVQLDVLTQLHTVVQEHAEVEINKWSNALDDILVMISDNDGDYTNAFSRWETLRDDQEGALKDESLRRAFSESAGEIDESFLDLLEKNVELQKRAFTWQRLLLFGAMCAIIAGVFGYVLSKLRL